MFILATLESSKGTEVTVFYQNGTFGQNGEPI